MLHTFARVILATLFITTVAVDGRAQTGATLAGRVLDPDGGVLPGVTIVVRQTETSLQRLTTSDVQGRYTMAALPPGSYEIRAELAGFRPLVRSGVTLTIAQTVVVDLTMTLATTPTWRCCNPVWSPIRTAMVAL
jgi:hypothetical protein